MLNQVFAGVMAKFGVIAECIVSKTVGAGLFMRKAPVQRKDSLGFWQWWFWVIR